MMTSEVANCAVMMPLMWVLPVLAVAAFMLLAYFGVRAIVRSCDQSYDVNRLRPRELR